MKQRKFLACLLVFVLVFTMMPANVLATEAQAPDGYNSHDYLKLRAFLELADENGVKNGQKLSASYDPDDPATWGSEDVISFWEENGELCLYTLNLYATGVTGTLDLSGCTTLEDLNCAENDLDAVNVSGCEWLMSLDCSMNGLTALDISGCYYLNTLLCHNNQLTELDLSDCTDIMMLYCNDNQLTELDISEGYSLYTLFCDNNQISELALGNHMMLTALNCANNNLSELDISGNMMLMVLYCGNNKIEEIDISGTFMLSSLDCGGNRLTSLDVSSGSSLTSLNCRSNQITELILPGDLSTLMCSNNPLGELDVTGLESLQLLYCSNIGISQLDVTMNGSLKYLECADNDLGSLNLTQNAMLKSLDCSGNGIYKLDVSANPELNSLICADNNIPAVDVSANSKLWYIDVTGNPFTWLDLHSNSYMYGVSIDPVLKELDLSNTEYMPMDKIAAAGNGLVGMTSLQGEELWYHTLTAQPDEGSSFFGWYSDPECTRLISEDSVIEVDVQTTEGYYALFSGESQHAHRTELQNAKEPTCAEDGYTGDEVCIICGKIVEAGETIPSDCPSAIYEDVPVDSWFHEAVDEMTAGGLMNGIAEGTFAPGMDTNRAMLAVMLYRLEGCPDVSGMTTSFEDVQPGTWFYDAVVWAQQAGVVNGKSEISFAPADIVTREELVTMLHRYVGAPAAEALDVSAFADADQVSAFAADAMAWAVEKDIVEGIPQGEELLLAPQSATNRAQIAVMFSRWLAL